MHSLEGEELGSNLLRVNQRAGRYNSVHQGPSLFSLADRPYLSRRDRYTLDAGFAAPTRTGSRRVTRTQA